ncbi:MAG: hypothetical protein WBM62_05185, partial [Crocosphaera sp.]
ALPSPPHEAYREFGKILQEQYNFNRLINFYQKALEIPLEKILEYLDFLQLQDYETLGTNFEQKKQLSKAWITYSAGLKVYPTAVTLYLRLVNLCFKKLESFTHKKKSNQNKLLYSSDCSNSQSLEVEKIWKAINDNELIKTYQKETQIIDKKVVDTHPVIKDICQVFYLNQINNLDEINLQSLGISADYLRLNEDWKSNEEQQIEMSQNDINDNVYKVFWEADKRNQFQLSSIDNKCLYAICPYTGNKISSDQSLLLLPQEYNAWVFYRFVSNQQIFYIVTGNPASGFSKYFIYFPKEEISIILSGNFPKNYIQEAIKTFKVYVINNWKDIQTYLNNPLPKKIAVPISFWHFAHHYWNELTGIYKLYENDALDKIDQFLVVTEHYGQIKDIFPEIPSNRLNKISLNDLSNEILTNNFFVVRVGANFIKEDLAKRIYKASLKQASPHFLSEIERIKEKHFPLLLVTIRLDTRVWVSQITGITNIVKKLAEEFPDIGLVIDGFSLPCGLVGLSWFWAQKCIKIETEASLAIRSLLPSDIQVYDIIGSPLYENAIWAHTIDLYLAQHGSAQHKIGWIANKPGVIHTNQATFANPEFLLVATAARENSIEPIIIPKEYIIPIEKTQKPNTSDKRKNLQNYDCNWEIMYHELLKLVHDINDKRGYSNIKR